MRPFRRPFTAKRDPEESADGASITTSQMGQLVAMFRFAKPYRVRLIVGTLAVVVSAGLGLVFPIIMGDLVDTVVPSAGAETGSLDRYGAILIAVFVVQAVFNYIRTYQLAVVGQGVVADIRRAVFDRVVRLPVPFFDRNLSGDITSRLDVGRRRSSVHRLYRPGPGPVPRHHACRRCHSVDRIEPDSLADGADVPSGHHRYRRCIRAQAPKAFGGVPRPDCCGQLACE